MGRKNPIPKRGRPRDPRRRKKKRLPPGSVVIYKSFMGGGDIMRDMGYG